MEISIRIIFVLNLLKTSLFFLIIDISCGLLCDTLFSVSRQWKISMNIFFSFWDFFSKV